MSLDVSYIAEKSQLKKSDLNRSSLIENQKLKKKKIIQIAGSVKIPTSQILLALSLVTSMNIKML